MVYFRATEGLRGRLMVRAKTGSVFRLSGVLHRPYCLAPPEQVDSVRF